MSGGIRVQILLVVGEFCLVISIDDPDRHSRKRLSFFIDHPYVPSRSLERGYRADRDYNDCHRKGDCHPYQKESFAAVEARG